MCWKNRILFKNKKSTYSLYAYDKLNQNLKMHLRNQTFPLFSMLSKIKSIILLKVCKKWASKYFKVSRYFYCKSCLYNAKYIHTKCISCFLRISNIYLTSKSDSRLSKLTNNYITILGKFDSESLISHTWVYQSRLHINLYVCHICL